MPFVVAAVAMGAGLGALTGWIGQLLAESTGNRNWRIGCGCMAVPLWGTMSVMAGWFLAIITAAIILLVFIPSWYWFTYLPAAQSPLTPVVP